MEAILQVQVTAKEMVADSIAAFEFTPLDGIELQSFDAGAHIDVHMPNGIVRQYSLYQLLDDRLSEDPPRYRICVLREPQSRGGSAYMLDTVKLGDVLSISAPRNHFKLDAHASQSLLFAGGIGITPILCMASQLARQGRSFDLHYCGRNLARMALLSKLADSNFAANVSVHIDDGDAQQLLNARATIGSPTADKHLYVCGPAGFMDHILSTARALGWNEAQLHREYFVAAPIDHSADGAFEIELRKSGRVITVSADQSAAQALIAASIPLSISCEQGVCGTCITRILEGEPDHRDMFLTESEQRENFMPCCSRSRTPRLVLDL